MHLLIVFLPQIRDDRQHADLHGGEAAGQVADFDRVDARAFLRTPSAAGAAGFNTVYALVAYIRSRSVP